MTSGHRDSFDLHDRRALLTGAVGILGTAFAEALAGRGCALALVDLDKEKLDALARDLETRFGVEAVGFVCDVGDESAVRALADEMDASDTHVDVVVNNAATKGRDLRAFLAPVGEESMETWREVMRVNLDGAYLVARAFGLQMIEKGIAGSVIQISSIYGLLGPDFRIYEGSEYNGLPITSPAVYSASKSGMVGLTRYLATAWGNHGIRVNALVPGGVRSGQNDSFVRRYSARIPLGRMADPEDIANPLVFLASDASKYITGQVIMADGGLSAW